jgi:hypothetical protein
MAKSNNVSAKNGAKIIKALGLQPSAAYEW